MFTPPVVFLGPTFHAVRAAAVRRFSANPEDVLVLANTPAASQNWRGVLREQTQGIWQPKFFALEDWFLENATLITEKQWVTSADRRFLLRAILPALRPRLKVLHRLSGSNDLVRQLDLLIADLRHAVQENFHFGGDWGDDLQLTVAEYNRRLGESNATDIENAPRLWAESSAQMESEAASNSTIVFDQIVAPSPSQWRGISALAAGERSTLVVLVAPWIEAAADWNEIISQVAGTSLENVLALWKSSGAEVQFVPEEIAPSRRGAIHALLKHRAAPPPANVTLTAAHTSRDEIERIADHLKSTASRALELEKATLVLPDPASYVSVLEPEFQARGLPFEVLRARPHSSYPLVARVLRLLALHGSDWTLNEIADLFGDGLLQLCSEENEARQSLDIHRLRDACFKANLNAILDNNDCLQRLQNSQKEFDRSLENDLHCIQKLRDKSEELSNARSANAWREAVFEMLDLTLSHLWDEDQGQPVEARTQLTILLRAVENVAARAECWLGKEWLQGNNRDANFWLDCLRLELESAKNRLDSDEEIGACLPVVSPFSLLSHVPRLVYLAGLSEGAWPSPEISGTLLSRHRNELAPLRAHRPDATQMALYQLALCLGEAEEIHLLHPVLQSGREVLRSPLLEDIAICWGELPELPRPNLPTSRARLLETLGVWLQSATLESLTLSPSLREILSTMQTDSARLDALLRISRERNSDDIIGTYDGALGERGAELLQTLPGEWRTLSATSLKTYARCPLRSFFQKVLRLEVGTSLSDDLSAADSGDLIHKILERFAREYSVPLDSGSVGEAWFKLQNIARYEVEQRPLRPILREVELLHLIGQSTATPAGVLGQMLLAEIAQQKGEMEKPAFSQPLVPIHKMENLTPPALADGVEIPFEFDIHIEKNSLHLTGRMDRVLRSRDGTMLAIVDYKTQAPGTLPNFYHANWGLDFQLPLYLLATRSLLRAWLQNRGGSTPMPILAATFFALREARWQNSLGESDTLGRNQTKTGPGAISQSHGKELEPEIFQAWLDISEKRLAFIADLLAGAQFNLSFLKAEEAGCSYCDYRTICRRDDALAARRLEVAHEKAAAGQNDVYVPRPLLRDAARDKK